MSLNSNNFKTVTLVDQVEERIIQYIKSNQLIAGSTIPSEKELAASLNVGRSVVREALSRLKMLGLVESRTRRGIVLCEPNVLESLNKVINPYMLGEKAILDLLGFRIALEVGIVDQLFQNLTDKGIIELSDIVKDQKSLGGNRLTVDSELAFHKKLYEISNNEIIMNFQIIILPIFSYVHDNMDLFIPFNEKFEENRKLITHNDLLELIINKDKEGYRKAIIDSFASYTEFISSAKI